MKLKKKKKFEILEIELETSVKVTTLNIPYSGLLRMFSLVLFKQLSFTHALPQLEAAK